MASCRIRLSSSYQATPLRGAEWRRFPHRAQPWGPLGASAPPLARRCLLIPWVQDHAAAYRGATVSSAVIVQGLASVDATCAIRPQQAEVAGWIASCGGQHADDSSTY